MVLFPAVETSPFLFGQGFSYCSQSAFTERGKEKGSSEIEEDRCGEISDPSNSVFCISACIVTGPVIIVHILLMGIEYNEKVKSQSKNVHNEFQI